MRTYSKAEALEVLAGPLRFGDEAQIKALADLRVYTEACPECEGQGLIAVECEGFCGSVECGACMGTGVETEEGSECGVRGRS